MKREMLKRQPVLVTNFCRKKMYATPLDVFKQETLQDDSRCKNNQEQLLLTGRKKYHASPLCSQRALLSAWTSTVCFQEQIPRALTRGEAPPRSLPNATRPH